MSWCHHVNLEFMLSWCKIYFNLYLWMIKILLFYLLGFRSSQKSVLIEIMIRWMFLWCFFLSYVIYCIFMIIVFLLCMLIDNCKILIKKYSNSVYTIQLRWFTFNIVRLINHRTSNILTIALLRTLETCLPNMIFTLI